VNRVTHLKFSPKDIDMFVEEGSLSAFKALDVDHDGLLTRGEFAAGAATFRPPLDEKETKYAFRSLDKDNSGKLTLVEYEGDGMTYFALPITLAEFQKRMLAVHSSFSQAFSSLGANPAKLTMFKEGSRRFKPPLTDDEAEYAFKGLDVNHDGSMSSFEFFQVLQFGRFSPTEDELAAMAASGKPVQPNGGTAPSVEARCPGGYFEQSGNRKGDSGLSSGLKAPSIGDCAAECRNESHCLSFEFSPSLSLCNLNDKKNPSGETYEDYKFCSKAEAHLQALPTIAGALLSCLLLPCTWVITQHFWARRRRDGQHDSYTVLGTSKALPSDTMIDLPPLEPLPSAAIDQMRHHGVTRGGGDFMQTRPPPGLPGVVPSGPSLFSKMATAMAVCSRKRGPNRSVISL